MAQKNATPEKKFHDALKANGLNVLTWTVMKELEHKLIVRHRITGEVKTISK